MIKFPEITQFRTVCKNVGFKARYVGTAEDGSLIMDHSKLSPKLTFTGTVKLHGSNAGIVCDIASGTPPTYQSRERELSLQYDNAGFMLYMKQHEDLIVDLVSGILEEAEDGPLYEINQVAIFGEWCGQGIQKGVGISELPKMFVIFAVKLIQDETKSCWFDVSKMTDWDYWGKESNIYTIYQFPTYKVTIDFQRPEEAQNLLVKWTEEVETECPVARRFGVSGVGEGIVWTCREPGWYSSRYWFKVKGEKHSVSKVKTLASVDIDAVNTMNEFIEFAVTENRLEQGLDNLVREQLKPFEMKSLGDFIRWVYNDVVKECQDEIVANQIDVKKLGSAVANKARPWYINKHNSGVF